MKTRLVPSRRLAAILVAAGLAAFAGSVTAAPPYKPEKSDTGKPPAPPQAPKPVSPYKPEKSDAGKPPAPGASAARRAGAATGPGTQTEDDAYVGVRRK